jgi:hypothetical protein
MSVLHYLLLLTHLLLFQRFLQVSYLCPFEMSALFVQGVTFGLRWQELSKASVIGFRVINVLEMGSFDETVRCLSCITSSS